MVCRNGSCIEEKEEWRGFVRDGRHDRHEHGTRCQAAIRQLMTATAVFDRTADIVADAQRIAERVERQRGGVDTAGKTGQRGLQDKKGGRNDGDPRSGPVWPSLHAVCLFPSRT
ncbi:hypothetical protein GN330_18950 [Nitratireductor sp. CAU 1489]|uniref:Uncharacterized protein n=1 Tax=Nitratireductor arenosus TaxID=2682096 RepID=A0A844QMS3_9HYPH|nr:hypothetical protein [Nitratireductor arenosus]MVA99328.1 hypothetical protein [Nitratireductor arenosus]